MSDRAPKLFPMTGGATGRGKICDACVLTVTAGAAKPQPSAGEGRRGLGGSNGEAPARSRAGGGGADFSGEQPGRRLPHAHLQLPQPDSRFDSLF